MMSGFKPPLTFDELHEIGVRNPDNKDVVRLLWEIKRLHAIVHRADQLAESMPKEPAGAVGIILGALRSEIKDEPVVIAKRQETQELLGQKVKPGDDYE
jgi:hypothetical protein